MHPTNPTHRTLSACLIAFALSSLTACESAEQPEASTAAEDSLLASADKPQAQTEIDRLYGFMRGYWSCETTFPAGARGPGSPEGKLHGTLTVRKDLNGAWYRTVLAEDALRIEAFQGYDAATRTAFIVGVDSMGGTNTGTSPGRVGDSITLLGQGIVMGRTVGTRVTLTDRPNGEVGHRLEVDRGSGLQLQVSSICKRSWRAPGSP